MAATKIFNLWAKRSPEWETKYEDTLLKAFCDYGKGSTSYQETRAKLFGAGYELYILAFFIGLYHGQTKDLVADKAKRKDFGWAIENWGTAEARGGRKQYGQIREYMFMALVARTEIDWIALDKGDITPRKVVDLLIDKMEKYATSASISCRTSSKTIPITSTKKQHSYKFSSTLCNHQPLKMQQKKRKQNLWINIWKLYNEF